MTTHEYTVRFEDDPPVVPSVPQLRIFADTLRENTGRISLLGVVQNPRCARQYAYRIRKALDSMRMFAPAGSFDAQIKTMFGTTYIYVRHVGEGG